MLLIDNKEIYLSRYYEFNAITYSLIEMEI